MRLLGGLRLYEDSDKASKRLSADKTTTSSTTSGESWELQALPLFMSAGFAVVLLVSSRDQQHRRMSRESSASTIYSIFLVTNVISCSITACVLTRFLALLLL